MLALTAPLYRRRTLYMHDHGSAAVTGGGWSGVVTGGLQYARVSLGGRTTADAETSELLCNAPQARLASKRTQRGGDTL